METVIDKLSRVSSKIAEYQQALSKISEKRQRWNTATRQTLYKTLNNIREMADLNWTVRIEDGIENFEEVIFQFQKSKSGIVEKRENEIKSRVKHGGGLIFDQEYNGDICVYVTYPFIEDSVDKQPEKKLDRLPPERITEDYIINQVIRFLDEMIKWENSTSKITIGYKWNGG